MRAAGKLAFRGAQNSFTKNMEELIKKLTAAKHCIAFTGAGSSTLAGIRDFRGKDGLYKDFDPEKVLKSLELNGDRPV